MAPSIAFGFSSAARSMQGFSEGHLSGAIASNAWSTARSGRCQLQRQERRLPDRQPRCTRCESIRPDRRRGTAQPAGSVAGRLARGCGRRRRRRTGDARRLDPGTIATRQRRTCTLSGGTSASCRRGMPSWTDDAAGIWNRLEDLKTIESTAPLTTLGRQSGGLIVGPRARADGSPPCVASGSSRGCARGNQRTGGQRRLHRGGPDHSPSRWGCRKSYMTSLETTPSASNCC